VDNISTATACAAVKHWLRGAREQRGLAALPQAKRLKAERCNRSLRDLVRAGRSFLKREDGPTAVEYAVLLGLIVLLCVAILVAFAGLDL